MSWIRWGGALKFFKGKESQLYVYHSCYGKMRAHITEKEVPGGRYFEAVNSENLVNLVGILLLDWLHGEFTGETTDVDGVSVKDDPDYDFVYWIVQEIAHRLGVADNLKEFPDAFDWELATPERRKEMIDTYIENVRKRIRESDGQRGI